jgi:hypothetical protein
MTVQFKKTYKDINVEMFLDEIRDLLKQRGILAGKEKLQTYALPSGATQSRVTLSLKTVTEQKDCGSVHIKGSPSGETQMIISFNEELVPQDTISSFQQSIDLVLEAYEVKW